MYNLSILIIMKKLNLLIIHTLPLFLGNFIKLFILAIKFTAFSNICLTSNGAYYDWQKPKN